MRGSGIIGVIVVIWLIVAFALGVLWYVDEDTPQPILLAGGFALLVAALPWLAYRPLVGRLRKRRDIRSARRACAGWRTNQVRARQRLSFRGAVRRRS